MNIRTQPELFRLNQADISHSMVTGNKPAFPLVFNGALLFIVYYIPVSVDTREYQQCVQSDSRTEATRAA
jgi:hypothetical protein